MKTKEAYRPSHAYDIVFGGDDTHLIGPDNHPILMSHLGTHVCDSHIDIYSVDPVLIRDLLNEAYERGYRDGQTKGK